MQSVHDLLYLLSNAFLLPTLLGTLAAFAYGTYVVGQFLSDAADRRINRRSMRAAMEAPESRSRFLELPWRAHLAEFRRTAEHHAPASPVLDKHVADIEHSLSGRIERLGIVAKAGPMLGLIGTLIPLQPALAGLARGDMQAMGANLQIGFTTTVLGLLVGGTCYAISVILRHWHQQDVTDIHFLIAQWADAEQGLSHDTTIQSAHIIQPNGARLAAGIEAVRRPD